MPGAPWIVTGELIVRSCVAADMSMPKRPTVRAAVPLMVSGPTSGLATRMPPQDCAAPSVHALLVARVELNRATSATVGAMPLAHEVARSRLSALSALVTSAAAAKVENALMAANATANFTRRDDK